MVGNPARHNLEKEAPDGVAAEMLDEGLTRRDLTALDFVTIDSASTEDMDDALYAESTADGKLLLTVAIADPTARIAEAASWITPQSARLYQLSAGLQHSNAAARAVGRPLLPAR